jgi:prepilin-type N-terminal cleavage/methylation domain-containing protein
MARQGGYTIIELLIVIAIIGLIVTMIIPGYSNYNQEQTVVQSANIVRDELQSQMNKSDSGVNGHWFGISFRAKNSASDPDATSYKLFEMTPKAADNLTIICPITIFSINTAPCSEPQQKKLTQKNYMKGVYLDKIIRITKDGTDLDTPSFIDVRFNQSPKSGQIAISTISDDNTDAAKIARVELILKNNTHERSVVIDAGNICDKGIVLESNKCGGITTGGPRPGKIFIVNRE